MHQRKEEKMIESAEGTSPQNHEANDVEGRSTDPEEGRGRRQVVGSL